MPDLADQIFNGTFDVPVTYKTDASDVGTEVLAIISENYDPGQESGKGLTVNMRGNEARWVTILLKVSEVAERPPIHSQVIEGGDTYDLVAADRTRAGTWRCKGKAKERGRRKHG
jgi:hypothetical protein